MLVDIKCLTRDEKRSFLSHGHWSPFLPLLKGPMWSGAEREFSGKEQIAKRVANSFWGSHSSPGVVLHFFLSQINPYLFYQMQIASLNDNESHWHQFLGPEDTML